MHCSFKNSYWLATFESVLNLKTHGFYCILSNTAIILEALIIIAIVVWFIVWDR